MFNHFVRSSRLPLRVPQTSSLCASQLRLAQSFNRYYSDLSRSGSQRSAKSIAADGVSKGQRGRSKNSSQGHHDQSIPEQSTEERLEYVGGETKTPSAEQLLQWMEPVESPGNSNEVKRSPKRMRKKQDGPKSVTVANAKEGKRALGPGEGNDILGGLAQSTVHKTLVPGKPLLEVENGVLPGENTNVGRKEKGDGVGVVKLSPRKSRKPAKPAKSAKSAKPVKPANPAKPTNTAATDKTSENSARKRVWRKGGDEYVFSDKQDDGVERSSSHQIPPNAPKPAIIKELKEAYKRCRIGKATGDVRRVHVISNELCGR
jgi:hypothetical protein